jgi:putative DNA primase/helicase
MPFQNFFILVGKGANGKSTFTSLLAKMLGHDNVTSMSLQTISEGSFELGHLYLKNANIMGDLPKKAFQDVGRIKELCGGDNITSKVKYKEPMQFNNFAKLISACNEVPQTPDLSDGFFRRAIIINFPNSFAGKENKNLLDELCQPAYLFDFFVKSIKAFMQALERGNLSRNDTPEARKTTYLIYSNSAMVFCNDFLEYDPEDQTPSQQLYEAYITWCREKKVVAKEEVTFFKSLYLFFGHKVWKKRIVDSYSDKTVRRYVIAGVGWRNPPSTTNSPEPTPQ